MQKFQNTHSDHERSTRIVSDYVDEQPENYEDVTDDLALSTPLPEQGGNTQEDLIKFDDQANSAPFPSAIVIFKEKP